MLEICFYFVGCAARNRMIRGRRKEKGEEKNTRRRRRQENVHGSTH